MCGRYVLALRPSEIRHQLQDAQMPVDDAPEDSEVRHTYNFAPGNHGIVYRADAPGFGGARDTSDKDALDSLTAQETPLDDNQVKHESESHDTKYKLQAMKWGLIPFWTKRNPDYGSMLKTINCRDDSLIEDRGMWTSMKKKKRCIVVIQGFYEWLKKNNGKERIPHFVKRKDGQLMCLAGLWDCVKYEDSEEKLYSYTIITTDSNKQLNFLHDRMPVILDNGSDAIRTWLDPARTEWSKDLQSLLKPYSGELECYPVSKDVGKVGNNSPQFVVPINSAENRSNIANFFGNQKKLAKGKGEQKLVQKTEDDLTEKGIKVEHDVSETRETDYQHDGTEDNAPLPTESRRGVKREHRETDDDGGTADSPAQQKQKLSAEPSSQSPKKTPSKPTRNTRSATSNGTAAKASPKKKAGDGSQKITAFFGK
ncbi:DUF159-domain-containing protein [Mytilinidion resinicola]|uniref:DUF159-domain-containing protein n=1 Tax=Mytilinidion resinicola TaxID=574789 RepID=A0A6A6YWT5_9PEZI|nr:DUF159-domain-containing protein [Mytilinidion resinicola]KAF2812445.1 DUF159-domain-containing protein [Mytilinidion resinicola]